MALSRPVSAGVTVAIDELVLDGVAPGDPLVAAAIERAITRAMAGHDHGLADPATIAAATSSAVATSAEAVAER